MQPEFGDVVTVVVVCAGCVCGDVVTVVVVCAGVVVVV
jgi:hypothetical protein